jgi:hypothetical protein
MAEIDAWLQQVVAAALLSDTTAPGALATLEAGRQARTKLLERIQRDQVALDTLIQLIAHNWHRTPIPTVEAKIAFLSETDPLQVSRQILEALYLIAIMPSEPSAAQLADEVGFVEQLRQGATVDQGSFFTVAAVQGLVKLANAEPTRLEANAYLYRLLDNDDLNLHHKVLIGLGDLKEPAPELFYRVLQLAEIKPVSRWLSSDYIVNGRAIEVLGRWGIVTPEVIDVIRLALALSSRAGDRLLLQYAEEARQKLQIH